MRYTLLGLVLAWFILAGRARALIEVGGKEPVHDQNWPAGTLDVANHKSRLVYHTGGLAGAPLTFLYRGNTEILNDVLAKFAQIKAPDLLVVVQDGVLESSILGGGRGKARQDNTVDWTFAVWTSEEFYDHLQRSGGLLLSWEHSELPPPRLDVYASE